MLLGIYSDVKMIDELLREGRMVEAKRWILTCFNQLLMSFVN